MFSLRYGLKNKYYLDELRLQFQRMTDPISRQRGRPTWTKNANSKLRVKSDHEPQKRGSTPIRTYSRIVTWTLSLTSASKG
jgi:hypothetical protein